MKRLAGTIAGMTIALLLAACGGGGVDRTATARAGDANDAATVTAFARGTGASGAGRANTTGATGPAGNGGSVGSFRFATLPSGNTGGSASTAAAGNAPRGAAGTASGTRGTPGSASSGTVIGVSGSTYKDPQGRYTFTIPQGWRVQQSANAAADVQVSPPQALRGIMQVASEDVDPSITLDDYVNGTIGDLRNNVTNFQTVPNSTQNLTISGVDARRFDFTGQQNGVTLKGAVFLIRKDSSAYILLVAAVPADFDMVLAQARVTVDSFTFL